MSEDMSDRMDVLLMLAQADAQPVLEAQLEQLRTEVAALRAGRHEAWLVVKDACEMRDQAQAEIKRLKLEIETQREEKHKLGRRLAEEIYERRYENKRAVKEIARLSAEIVKLQRDRVPMDQHMESDSA